MSKFGIVKWVSECVTLLAPLVSYGSLCSSSSSILENFEGLSDYGAWCQNLELSSCSRNGQKECQVGQGPDWSKFGFGRVGSYQVFRPHYLPRLSPMVLFVVVLLQFLILLRVFLKAFLQVMLCELLENSCWSLLKKIDKNDVLISKSDDYGTLIHSNITCFSTSMNTLLFSNFEIIFRIFVSCKLS